MKHSIKIFTIIMVLFLMLTSVSIGEGQINSEFVVASSTAMSGEFYTDLWGNNTADTDVRHLIHGYSTVIGRENFERKINPEVVELKLENNKRGDKVYTFTVAENLKFSDGEKVGAKDYVLSLVLRHHPLMRELGAKIKPMDQIVGGREFQLEGVDFISGVRIIDERTFSIALKEQNSPNYNELSLVDLFPTPLHALFKDTDIVDNGKGVTVNLSLDAIKQAMDGENGYRSHPQVVSGPYKLVSFNGNEAVFEKNENYSFNQAKIEKIKFIYLTNEQMKAAIDNDTVQLINKISSAKAIREISASNKATSSSYPRSGFSYLSISPYSRRLQNVAVRKAIIHAIDRQAIVDSFFGGNASVVNGYYGIGQWMAKYYQDIGKDEIFQYDYNLKKAEKFLSSAGYSSKKPLKLILLISQGNEVAEIVAKNLAESLKKIGAELVVERKPWAEVLDVYYKSSEQNADLIFMSSNFGEYFDPSVQFLKRDNDRRANFAGIKDEYLSDAANKMRSTDTENHELYYKRWLSFQKIFNQNLPLIPLYSQNYTDVYSNKLVDYDIKSNVSWADAIVNSSYAK